MVDPPATTTVPEVNESVQTSTVPQSEAVSFKFKTNDGSFIADVKESMTLTAVDSSGDTVSSYKPAEAVYLETLLGSAEYASVLTADDFRNGSATFDFTPHSASNLQFKANDGKITGESAVLKSMLFSDVSSSGKSYRAISFLKKRGVINGYPDGSFKPDGIVSRVEALKFILEAANESLVSGTNLPFKDTSKVAWYTEYVATAFGKSIVQGYPDHTFKPANTVNRAEFLKMLLVSMDFQVPDSVNANVYFDVKKDSWYASYVKFAKDKNLIETDGRYFKPDEGMTREDVAELIYRAVMLKVSKAEAYRNGLSVTDAVLDHYFS